MPKDKTLINALNYNRGLAKAFISPSIRNAFCNGRLIEKARRLSGQLPWQDDGAHNQPHAAASRFVSTNRTLCPLFLATCNGRKSGEET